MLSVTACLDRPFSAVILIVSELKLYAWAVEQSEFLEILKHHRSPLTLVLHRDVGLLSSLRLTSGRGECEYPVPARHYQIVHHNHGREDSWPRRQQASWGLVPFSALCYACCL